MKNLDKFTWLLLSLLFVIACGKEDVPPKPELPTEYKEGLNYSPTAPDADSELTITFKAASSSQLYGYTGDVYIHIGVISEGTWLYVPAAWDQNLAKCKMVAVSGSANTWSIKLSPTIRQWFASGETPVTKLGIVIRSADGTKKGITDDSFVDVTDSKYKAFEPAAVKNATLPANMQYGINVVDNSTVTLVLYDKDKNGNRKDFAHIIGDFNNWTLSNDEKSQMNRDDAAGCWWITINNLNADTEYAFQYYVGTKGSEAIRLGDAYSRKILDPNNDQYIPASTYTGNKTYPSGAIGIASVFKIRPETYNWKVTDFNAPDKSELVIYEMLLRDFTSSGDINGALAKLDYLEELGVNAIELMPTQEFDGNDSWGYNPCFYFAMDKAYGTDAMYKQFIDACHERGMAVILDIVYNHATGEHPFAKLYWNASANKTASNNPWFNVDAPHPYSVFHDFNHESELVRNFFKRNLQFLLEEYKFDGFRFDLTKGFTQKSSSESTASIYDATRIAILKDYNATIKSTKANAYVILEHFADDKEETELANDGMMVWRNLNNAYCQSGMGYVDGSDFSGLYYVTSSRPANSLVGYMESHDEERVSYKQTQWGFNAIKTDLTTRMNQLTANAALFFTVPGPKMIWQFGELGYDVSIDENGRTGKKPIKWEYYDVSQRKKVYDTYADLIELRSDYPQLFSSTAVMNWEVTTAFWNNGRYLTITAADGKKLVVVANFTNSEITKSTSFPATGTWYNYQNGNETIDVSSASENISVPANNFRIFTSFKP